MVRARVPTNGRMLKRLQSSAPATKTMSWRLARMRSKAAPRACADEAQALEKPNEWPLIPKQATRFMFKVPAMLATIPIGLQRCGPFFNIKSRYS